MNIRITELTVELVSSYLIPGHSSPHAVTTCLRPACQRAMWSGKMAARRNGCDGNVNAGNSDSLVINTAGQVTIR